MSESDIALLVVRFWSGVVMIAHGVNHGRNLEGTARWFARIGFRRPELNAFLSSANELAIGVGLIVGFLTPVAAAALAATMFVAFWSIHRFAGFFVFHRPDEGYEYVATLTVLAFALALMGPGSVSLDAALGLDETLSGLTGVGILGLGFLAAIGQLALLWRKPAREETR